VLRMVNNKIESPLDFTWASQLKFRWPDAGAEEAQDLYINICDAQFTSSHEYVGNPGRLVITALTDRCYITLTQALRLMMGGAPQGPAGTGKTETTKDLVGAVTRSPACARMPCTACACKPSMPCAHKPSMNSRPSRC
jgi:dynein heavy chain